MERGGKKALLADTTACAKITNLFKRSVGDDEDSDNETETSTR